jgi:hypothetical protein
MRRLKTPLSSLASRLTLLLLGSTVAGGCATPSGKGAAGPMSGRRALTGVWEGVFKQTLGDGTGAGDTRIERQAWRLAQAGETVSGFYVVELTVISGDGRPFLCNRQPRFSTLLRFDVRGRVGKDGVDIDEVGDVWSKGPCRPAYHMPAHFRASLTDDVLTLIDGDRRLPLYRRTGVEAAAAAQALLAFANADGSWSVAPGFPGPPRGAEATTPAAPSAASGIGPTMDGSASAPTANLEGMWVWERRAALPGGDEKVEREEWHLVQDGSSLAGYYDRAVHQMSTDGHAYRCNSALDFRVLTRYQVSGEVRGDQVMLHERGFEILEGSPCDDGRRRLDAYQGHAAPGEIRLLWGVGTQVLKRARPNVPTQRF